MKFGARSCASSRMALVRPDQDTLVAKIRMGRDFEIARCRYILEDAPGQVEPGTVTGTVETANPCGAQISSAGFGAIQRYATKMGTDCRDDEELRAN